jgi:hypothetical protein
VLILLFLFAVIVIYFSEKKKERDFFACGGTVHLWQWYCSKQIVLVELGYGLLFPEGKERFEQD